MMKTFERYFFTELLLKLFATVLVLNIVVIGQLLSKLLSRIAVGAYPSDVIEDLLLYGTFDALIFLLPFSAMLAVTSTLGRYYRDSEIYAAFSFGVSQIDICRVLMKCALPLSLLLFVLVMEVSPAGEQRYQTIKQMGQQRSDVTLVTVGDFFSPRKDIVLFVEDYDRVSGKLYKLFIAKFLDDKKVIEIAKSAEQKHDENGVKHLHLYDGRLYEGVIGQDDYQVFSYREHIVSLPTSSPPKLGEDPEEMNFSALLASKRIKDKAELQWRLMTVISLPILMLLAFSLSQGSPRSGRNFSIVIVILVFLVYENLIILLIDRITKGELALLPGAWLVPGIALAAVMVMLTRRRIRQYFSGFRN